jgi:hypothetical protein
MGGKNERDHPVPAGGTRGAPLVMDRGIGRGILAIWHDIAPEAAADVLDWYDREHHFERLAVPGFRNVRRHHAIEASPALFIRYETDDVDVLGSPAYLARLNGPTPWTLQSQPNFRNNSRTVCIREARVGTAQGGFVLTLRLSAAHPLTLRELGEWPVLADALMQHRGILGAEFWCADPSRSRIPTREKDIRQGEDIYVSAVLVVHASDAAALRQLPVGSLPGLAVPQGVTLEAGLYQLVFSDDNAAS